MNRKKRLALGIALVLGIFWSSAALGSSISLDVWTNGSLVCTGGVSPGFPLFAPVATHGLYNFSHGEALALGQPTVAGPFSQQAYGNGTYSVGWQSVLMGESSYPSEGSYPEGATIVLPVGIVDLYISYGLNQEGPLRFTDASWTTTLFVNGTEQMQWTEYWHDFGWSAELDWPPELGPPRSYVSGFYDLGEIEVPIYWDGHGYSAGGSLDFTVRLDVTGNVIDTTASAPLPSALLLFGSGLGGVLINGRRKLVGRS
jgi:hypothetical protein